MAASRSLFFETDHWVTRMATKGWFIPAFFSIAVLGMALMYYYVNSGSVEISNRHALRTPDVELRSTPPRGYFAQREGVRHKGAAKIIAPRAEGRVEKSNAPPAASMVGKGVKKVEAESIPSVVAAKVANGVVNDGARADANLAAPKRGRLLERWREIEVAYSARAATVAAALDREALRWRNNIGRDAYMQATVAWALFFDGDITAAEAQMDRALTVRPSHEYLLQTKIEMARATNRWQRAADGYVALSEARPSDPQPRFNAAVVYSRMGEFGAADYWFDRTLDVDPNHAKALYNLAAVAQHGGRLSEAEELWTRLTAAHPNVISAWYQRGAIAFDLGQYPEAGFAFEQVIRIDPMEADAYVNLGETQMVAGNFEAAYQSVSTALQLDACHDAGLATMVDVCDSMAVWFPTERARYQSMMASCRARLDAMGLATTMYANVIDSYEVDSMSLDLDSFDESNVADESFIFDSKKASAKDFGFLAGSDAETSKANRAALE